MEQVGMVSPLFTLRSDHLYVIDIAWDHCKLI